MPTDAEKFKDEVFLGKLEVHVRLVRTNMIASERFHSWLRRYLHTKGINTHRENLQTASAMLCIKRFKHTNGQKCLRNSAGVDARDASGSFTSSKARNTPAQHGGPCRLFVRDQTYGKEGRPDLGLLGIAYKSLDASHRKSLEERAAESRGTLEANRKDGLSIGSFGPTSRQVKRRQYSMAHSAACVQVQTALAVCEKPIHEMSKGEQAEHAMTVVRRQAPFASMPMIVSKAKNVLKQVAVQHNRCISEDLQRLASWQMSAPVHDQLTSFLPGSSTVEQHCVAVPCRRLGIIQVCPRSDTLTKVAEVIDSKSKWFNLQTALLLEWSKRHDTIMHGDSEPLPTAKKSTKQKPKCDEWGMCFCTSDGMRCWQLALRYIWLSKKECKRRSANWELLTDAFVVAVFFGVNPDVDDVWEDAWATISDRDRQPATCDHIWHIGYFHGNPYEISIQRLLPQPNAILPSSLLMPNIVTYKANQTTCKTNIVFTSKCLRFAKRVSGLCWQTSDA